MLRSLVVAFFVLGALLSGSASARTWTVALDGSGDFTLISAACNAAASGDIVQIRPGQYDEPDYAGFDKPWFHVTDKSITVIGDEQNPSAVVVTFALHIEGVPDYLKKTDINVEGLTFQGPTGRLGPTGDHIDVGHCVFQGTGDGPPASWGDTPLYITGRATVLVHDCAFRGNIIRGFGGAVNVPSAIAIWGHGETIRDCVFENNVTDAELAGALMITTDADDPCTIENCVFTRNQAPVGAAVSGTRIVARNCTFYGNQGEGCLALYYSYPYGSYVTNCIVAATNGGSICDPASAWSLEVHCTDFWENEPAGPYPEWATYDCFSLNPLFCDPDNGDFDLHADSPCANRDGCGLVGALPVACGESPVKEMTWGRVKARFLNPAK